MKLVLLIFNALLFISGIILTVPSIFALIGGIHFGLITEILNSNDGIAFSTLSFGTFLIYTSSLGFKSSLSAYGRVLRIFMLAQLMLVMSLGVPAWRKSIGKFLWNKIGPYTIAYLEHRYHCCSFDGKSNSWKADIDDYQSCTLWHPQWSTPIETCWDMSERKIRALFSTIAAFLVFFLVVEILIIRSLMGLKQNKENHKIYKKSDLSEKDKSVYKPLISSN